MTSNSPLTWRGGVYKASEGTLQTTPESADNPPATSSTAILASDIAAAAQLACLLEVSAPKPGNVSPGRHFTDATYSDFLASAAATGEPLGGAGTRPVGETVRLAVERTARWAPSNTNLGVLLLLAPLARAAFLRSPVGESCPAVVGGHRPHGDRMVVTPPWAPLRATLRQVLEATSVDDAREVYRAIRLAAPGGLGRVREQDVCEEPTMPLLDVMRLASHRDGIAREYDTAFDMTFGTGVPALDRARHDGLSWEDAVVETFLSLLAASPDTHVIRRAGAAVAERVSRQAAGALAAGGVRSQEGWRAIIAMDAALRDARNTANPGTTADLTAAAIFVVLVGGGWRPRRETETLPGV